MNPLHDASQDMYYSVPYEGAGAKGRHTLSMTSACCPYGCRAYSYELLRLDGAEGSQQHQASSRKVMDTWYNIQHNNLMLSHTNSSLQCRPRVFTKSAEAQGRSGQP